MTKTVTTSPPDKWAKSPSITRNDNTLWHDLCDGTVQKYNRVQVVTSPYLPSKAYRDNYSEVFGHE